MIGQVLGVGLADQHHPLNEGLPGEEGVGRMAEALPEGAGGAKHDQVARVLEQHASGSLAGRVGGPDGGAAGSEVGIAVRVEHEVVGVGDGRVPVGRPDDGGAALVDHRQKEGGGVRGAVGHEAEAEIGAVG